MFAALQGCLDLYDNFESKSALGLDKLSFILTRPEDLKLLDHSFDPVQRLRRTLQDPAPSALVFGPLGAQSRKHLRTFWQAALQHVWHRKRGYLTSYFD